MSHSEARIVILNYNGEQILPQCLPSIVEASKLTDPITPITLLDNQSTDSAIDWVKNNFPDIQIVISPDNRYLCSYNDYLKSISEKVCILLNNDIKVDSHFIEPLLQPFREDNATFLVAPRVMDYDGKRIQAGRSRAGLRFGSFWCNARYAGYEGEANTPSTTYSAGFGAFDREKFLLLGGYDDLYLPGIMEDVDLCYRAQKTGHSLRYEPRSVVYHIGQATFKAKFGSSGLSVLAHRNNFLFMWKNFSGFSFWFQHILFLLPRFLFSLLKGNANLIRGFWQALTLKRQSA